MCVGSMAKLSIQDCPSLFPQETLTPDPRLTYSMLVILLLSDWRGRLFLKKKSMRLSGFWGGRGNPFHNSQIECNWKTDPPPHPHPASTKYALHVLILTTSTFMGNLPFFPQHTTIVLTGGSASLVICVRIIAYIIAAWIEGGSCLIFHKFSVCTIFHSREECPPGMCSSHNGSDWTDCYLTVKAG